MNLLASLARYGAQEKARIPFDIAFGRAFTDAQEVKVLVIYEPNRISFSQVYPFLYFWHAFAERYNAQFRFVTSSSIAEGVSVRHQDATHILLQTWLTDPPGRIAKLTEQLRELPRSPRLIYLDSFANCDVRLLKDLEEFDLYYKKSLFFEQDRFLTATYGHTNLTEYYGQLYGISQKVTDWQVPRTALSKLRLAPNFLTDPALLRRFLGEVPTLNAARRNIDLHARLGGTHEANWYGAMRRAAEAQVKLLKNISLCSGVGVSRRTFWDELGRSKLCFSPFGYGELCWRDIEAMAMGAVVIKPTMSHIRTEPELYLDGETYWSVRWDFGDLEERVNSLLADDERREAIARSAWRAARSYLENNGPVSTYGDIFV